MCACSYHFFRSKILELIFISYLGPQVSFQADLWRGHATVLGLTRSVCDKRSISIWTQYENGLYRMRHSKLCSEIYGSHHRVVTTETFDSRTQRVQKCLEKDIIYI